MTEFRREAGFIVAMGLLFFSVIVLTRVYADHKAQVSCDEMCASRGEGRGTNSELGCSCENGGVYQEVKR